MTGGPAHRLDEVWARSPGLLGRRVGDEYVLVPHADGAADLDGVRTLNSVAAFVWEQLDGARPGREVVDLVVRHFEVERARAEADYLELVASLVAQGALAPARR